MLNKNYYINCNASLDDAILKMNINKIGFLAVVEDNFYLIGILTDSDLRKAFLEKKFNLKEVINKNPITMLHNIEKNSVITKLNQSYMRHMPIVDKDNILKDIIILAHEQRKFKSNKIIIMAGGLGSRLGELTKYKPKPMLNIGEKPILEHIIKNCIYYGFSQFMISVNYKQELIKEYFGDGSLFGINIEYIEENKRLGTGGALSIINYLEQDFIVMNGDIISSINLDDLLKSHADNNSDATICVRETSYKFPYGIIKKTKDNNFLSIEEKPIINYHINAGIYAFSPRSLDYLNKNEYCEITWFIKKIKENQLKVKVFEFSDFWVDIGDIDNYREINNKYSKIPDYN